MAADSTLNSVAVIYASLDVLTWLTSDLATEAESTNTTEPPENTSVGFVYNGTSYTIIYFPESYATYVYDINNSGVVAGAYSYATLSSSSHGYVYDGINYTNIDPSGSIYTWVEAINNSGEVAGSYHDGSRAYGFIYDEGNYTTVDFPGSYSTSVNAINDSGQVAGGYYDGSTSHGYIYDGITYTTIDFPNSTNTYALAMNDSGVVAGTYSLASSFGRGYGFIYDGVNYTTVDVPGSRDTYISDINNSGMVAGHYFDSRGEKYGFIYDGTTYTTLNVPSDSNLIVMDINDAGEVVGRYNTFDGSHGFVWNGTDYTTIDFPDGRASYLTAINDSGEVAGDTVTPCYCRGTMILTPRGEIPIEDLTIGDEVMTLSGEAEPIKWIGRRAYEGCSIGDSILPIHIAAGALAEGVPKRDLWVSPGHALYVDDRLANAEFLVNGATITRAKNAERVEYFHIELEHHNIVFAEAATAETYAECDNRALFQNMVEFAEIYPGDTRPSWLFCKPRLEWCSAKLTEIRRALLDRATALGHATDPNPDLHLILDAGKIAQPDEVDGQHYRFIVPAGTEAIWLASRTKVPAELEADSRDTRRLGVPVGRVVLSDGNLLIELGAGHPTLSDGFYEAEGGFRWTDGFARLPTIWLNAFPGGFTLDVHLAPFGLVYRSAGRSSAFAEAGRLVAASTPRPTLPGINRLLRQTRVARRVRSHRMNGPVARGGITRSTGPV